jgi:hypothetical protein
MALTAVVLLALPVIFLFAFQNHKMPMHPAITYDSYEKLWKEVDSLEQQGLTKSALEKAEAIYTLAKKSDNAPQVVKSLIYKAKYKQVLEEGGLEKTLQQFEEEIGASHFPARNILQSAAAELYWNYYQQNRWKFSQRTQTVNFNPEDIATWDLRSITNRVTDLYKRSLENTDSLKQMPIEPFSAILEKGNMPVAYRPTLFDFLAHRALDFFMNEEAYLTQPAYKFNLAGEDLFQSTQKFMELNVQTEDTLSGKYIALKILQQLLQFHQNDFLRSTLVDVELKRFAFLRNNSVNELKDSLYLNGLLELEKQYSSDEASAAVSYAIADFYLDRSAAYDPPVHTDHQYDKKTALEYCDKVIQKFPSTNAAKNCKALRESILKKKVTLTTEQVNIPDAPFRGLVQYKNVDRLYLRIIKNTEALRNKMDGENEPEKRYRIYLQQSPVQEWSQTLPVSNDYQEHSCEIKIPGITLGDYVIIGSSAEKFSSDSSFFIYSATSISRLSYTSKRTNNGYNFYVFDRESGDPLRDVTARTLFQQYNSKKRSYDFIETGKYRTDENGFFDLPASAKNESFRWSL